MRKWPAVPAASAEASCHVPAFAATPAAAAPSQSEGRFSVASTVPVSASTMLVGGAPVRILRIALTPIAVSIAFSMPLRTATLILIAMSVAPLSLWVLDRRIALLDRDRSRRAGRHRHAHDAIGDRDVERAGRHLEGPRGNVEEAEDGPRVLLRIEREMHEARAVSYTHLT